jgi:glycosyltransferase involved in cell wall biosynthesis
VGKRSLILVGALPPPVHGQSVAFEMFANHLRMRRDDVQVLDISSGAASADEAGIARSALHFLSRLIVFGGLILRRPGAVVYLTIAQSRLGFLRDLGFLLIGLPLGARFVWHMHGGNYGNFHASQPPVIRRVIQFAFSRVDRVVVLGEALRSMFDFDPRLEPRVRVVPNAIPPAVRLATQPRCYSSRDGDPFRLLFLSNMIESKGYFTILEAIKILKDESPFSVHADFCGHFFANPSDDVLVESAEQASELFDSRVAEWGIDSLVTYHGAVSGSEKAERLSRAHAFVLPTQYDNEGQPISIIEAMASGIPVLSTRYRAIPDLLVDGETGFFVDADEPRSIVDRVMTLGSDPELFESMSRRAIEVAGTKFSAAVHFERLEAILDECADSSRR